MKLRVLLLTALALGSAAVHADFRTVQQAYEISLSNFRAPATPNGMLTFKECDSCAQRSVRVDASTRYRVNRQAVDLAEFRNRLISVRDRAHEWVTVLHHLENDTITQISVTL